MKKLLAILLFALMLCTLIPFATVAAEDAPTVQLSIVDELETVNAGEEFQVQVDLLGLEDTAGLIAALVKIDYNPDVFELVPYFDEDEEVWMPPIEVGSKYNASSNKYIEFGQIFEDGTMETCLVKYNRATASATQVRREEHFFTVTFKVKDDATSGTYDLSVSKMDGVYHGNVKFEFAPINTSIKVIGSEPEVPSCNHEYFTPCEQYCMICGELTNPEASHNVVHVEAVEPTCEAEGNIEHWYCNVCGAAWLNAECTRNTNLKAVKLPMAEHEYIYACDQYCMNCGEQTNPRAKHNKIHVEAKEAVNCIEYGNKEYWYCEYCSAAWLDEAGRIQTNMMSVRIAGECVSNAEYACQDGECVNCGLPYAADADHTYTNAHDAICDVCGDVRDVVLPAEDIILFGGNSVSEIKNGLAFKFDAAVNGVVFDKKYYADYTNATVAIDGAEYKLVGLGAIANNKGLKDQTLDNIDGKYVMNVFANKVFKDEVGATSYAIRIINIPADKLDAEIIVRPYFIYEDLSGEQITVYGADQIQSYNGAL